MLLHVIHYAKAMMEHQLCVTHMWRQMAAQPECNIISCHIFRGLSFICLYVPSIVLKMNLQTNLYKLRALFHHYMLQTN